MAGKRVQPRKAENVTEVILKAWKEENPRGIWEMKVFGDDDEDTSVKVGYFRKPTRMELSASMTAKNDPLGVAEGLLRDCWLGGDEELLDEEDYFQGAVMQFQELMKVRAGEIKKL